MKATDARGQPPVSDIIKIAAEVNARVLGTPTRRIRLPSWALPFLPAANSIHRLAKKNLNEGGLYYPAGDKGDDPLLSSLTMNSRRNKIYHFFAGRKSPQSDDALSHAGASITRQFLQAIFQFFIFRIFIFFYKYLISLLASSEIRHFISRRKSPQNDDRLSYPDASIATKFF